jgi:hypothetical protein
MSQINESVDCSCGTINLLYRSNEIKCFADYRLKASEYQRLSSVEHILKIARGAVVGYSSTNVLR